VTARRESLYAARMAETKTLLRADEIQARNETFSHPFNPKSEVRGVTLSRAAGLSRAGVNLVRLAPGKESFAYHAHYYEEEWMYVLSGRGVAEIDDAEHEIGPGDFLGFPTGTAHHTRNPFDEELVYLVGGESRDYEVADFPRLGRRMVRRGSQIDIFKIADARPFGPLDD
jgi:uncharacterized cupin superfamily protein